MGENENGLWKVATVVLAVLLVGAVVAVVILAVNGGDEGDKKALDDQVQALEEQAEDLQEDIEVLEGELAEAEADEEVAEDAEDDEEEEEEGTVPGDEEQLQALAGEYANENLYVGEIFIDGDWARVGIAPYDPTAYQGGLLFYHKIDGEWTCVDGGTGLQYGDIPGAPESIFP